MSLDHDGTVLAVAYGAGAVNLWDVASGRLLDTLRSTAPGHSDIESASLSFSPDGKTIALAGALTEAISVWDLTATPAQARLIATGSGFGVHAVRFSHDGRTLAAVAGEDVAFWETTAGRSPRLAWRNDVSGFIPTIRRWRPAVGSRDVVGRTRVGRRRRVAVASRADRSHPFSPDGTYLASALRRDVAVWNARTRRAAAAYEIPKSPGAELELGTRGRELRVFAFSPDGKTIATGGRQGRSFGEGGRRGDLLLWNFTGDRTLTPLEGHPSGLRALAFSPDGRQLAAADGRRSGLGPAHPHRTDVLSNSRRGGSYLDRTGTKLAGGVVNDVVLGIRTPATFRGTSGRFRQSVLAMQKMVSSSFDGRPPLGATAANAPHRFHRAQAADGNIGMTADGRLFATGSAIAPWDLGRQDRRRLLT